MNLTKMRYEAFRDYGANYVQFFILDYDRLEEWRGVNFFDFRQAMANANAPIFDPAGDLRMLDPDGMLYEAALSAAWCTLCGALAADS